MKSKGKRMRVAMMDDPPELGRLVNKHGLSTVLATLSFLCEHEAEMIAMRGNALRFFRAAEPWRALTDDLDSLAAKARQRSLSVEW